MKTANTDAALDRLIGPLGACLTSARRLLALKADSKLQARVNYLAERCHEGLLTPEECAEYSIYVKFGTFVAILKSKARQLLVNSQGEFYRQSHGASLEHQRTVAGHAAGEPPL